MRVRAPATAMAGKLRRLHMHFTATIAMGKMLTHSVMTFIGKKNYRQLHVNRVHLR